MTLQGLRQEKWRGLANLSNNRLLRGTRTFTVWTAKNRRLAELPISPQGRAMAKKKSAAKNGNGDLEFADRLWSAANRLRGTVEAAEYKHIVLGLLFLKYLSDAFENRHKFLLRAVTDPVNTEYYVKEAPAEYIASVAEDKDEYLAANVFWIPPQARWSYLLANAHQPHLGRLIDEAMAAIEKVLLRFLGE